MRWAGLGAWVALLDYVRSVEGQGLGQELMELLDLGVQAGYGRMAVGPPACSVGAVSTAAHVRVIGGGSIPLVAAGGQFDGAAEPSLEEMQRWLGEQGVLDLLPEHQHRRAYLAFSRCPFGEKVTPAMKRGFFRRLAPWVDHLAIQKMDLGRFHDPKYIMSVELNDVTPINQPPMRVTPDVEQWLKEWALE